MNNDLKSIINSEIITYLNTSFDEVFESTTNQQEEFINKFIPYEISKITLLERYIISNINIFLKQIITKVIEASPVFSIQNTVIKGQIREGKLRRIQSILNQLNHTDRTEKRQPNFEQELEYIKKGKGELIPVTIICDVFIRNEATGESFAFEIKGPLPNSDQTKVSKEKIFKLFAMENPQITKAFFALPYNPYGTKAAYNWSFPKRWFDMNNSPVVLIAEEFWDFIGGTGTYELFIDEVNQLGKHYKERIYKEFLGIEPPTLKSF